MLPLNREVVVGFYCCLFLNRVSLCNPGCSGTTYTHRLACVYKDLPLPLQFFRLKVCATRPDQDVVLPPGLTRL